MLTEMIPSPVIAKVKQIASSDAERAATYLMQVTACSRVQAKKILDELVPKTVQVDTWASKKAERTKAAFDELVNIAALEEIPRPAKVTLPKRPSGLKPVDSSRARIKVNTRPFEDADTMDAVELATMGCDWLRKYASRRLNLVGASKIPGGIPALVAKIIEVRPKSK